MFSISQFQITHYFRTFLKISTQSHPVRFWSASVYSYHPHRMWNRERRSPWEGLGKFVRENSLFQIKPTADFKLLIKDDY